MPLLAIPGPGSAAGDGPIFAEDGSGRHLEEPPRGLGAELGCDPSVGNASDEPSAGKASIVFALWAAWEKLKDDDDSPKPCVFYDPKKETRWFYEQQSNNTMIRELTKRSCIQMPKICH